MTDIPTAFLKAFSTLKPAAPPIASDAANAVDFQQVISDLPLEFTKSVGSLPLRNAKLQSSSLTAEAPGIVKASAELPEALSECMGESYGSESFLPSSPLPTPSSLLPMVPLVPSSPLHAGVALESAAGVISRSSLANEEVFDPAETVGDGKAMPIDLTDGVVLSASASAPIQPVETDPESSRPGLSADDVAGFVRPVIAGPEPLADGPLVQKETDILKHQAPLSLGRAVAVVSPLKVQSGTEVDAHKGSIGRSDQRDSSVPVPDDIPIQDAKARQSTVEVRWIRGEPEASHFVSAPVEKYPVVHAPLLGSAPSTKQSIPLSVFMVEEASANVIAGTDGKPDANFATNLIEPVKLGLDRVPRTVVAEGATASVLTTRKIGIEPQVQAMVLLPQDAGATAIGPLTTETDLNNLSSVGQSAGANTSGGLLPHSSPTSQIAAAVFSHQVGTIELRLSPEELGHVSIDMRKEGDVMIVQISAERNDTLDLLKRNSDQLAAELRASGQLLINMSFGRWTGSGQSNEGSPIIPGAAVLATLDDLPPQDQLFRPKFVPQSGLYLRI